MQNSQMRWARVPFDHFIQFVQETHRILLMSMRGISGLQAMPGLIRALAPVEACARDQQVESHNDDLEEATQMAAFAKAEAESGFPLVHAHAIVGMWGALEALIDEVVSCWLVHVPELLQQDAILRIRLPLARFHLLDEEDRMGLVINELKREAKTAFKPGVAGFEDVLSMIGLGGPVEEEDRRALLEMRVVRNLWVHRRGVADRRAVDACPWADFAIGQRVQITHPLYHRYHDAIQNYVLTLINRVRRKIGLTEYGGEATAHDANGGEDTS